MDTSSVLSILSFVFCVSIITSRIGRAHNWAVVAILLVSLTGFMVPRHDWGPLYLGLMFVWGWMDHFINKYYSSRYKPATPPRNPTYTPKDVSVVVRTLGPPSTFNKCLQLWLANKPLEVIICTTQDHIDEVNRIVNETVLDEFDRAKVATIVSEKGARKQLLAGILRAKGKIIATCDNHIEWPAQYLIHMLPCFEDSNVAAAGPSIKVKIPEDRQDNMSPWEVAAVRLADRGPGSGKALHAAARWCWILAGTTGVYLASVLQSPEFAQAYVNDKWYGVPLDVGEDTFISRWILKLNMTIAIQWTNETDVTRTVKRTGGALLQQMLRWERSTVQSFWLTIIDVPQFKKHPLVKFRTYERLIKAPMALCHLIAWIFSLRQYPTSTTLLLAYYVALKYRDYRAFVAKYPKMRKHAWAAMLVDFSTILVGNWAIVTLSDNSWEHGEGGRKPT